MAAAATTDLELRNLTIEQQRHLVTLATSYPKWSEVTKTYKLRTDDIYSQKEGYTLSALKKRGLWKELTQEDFHTTVEAVLTILENVEYAHSLGINAAHGIIIAYDNIPIFTALNYSKDHSTDEGRFALIRLDGLMDSDFLYIWNDIDEKYKRQSRRIITCVWGFIFAGICFGLHQNKHGVPFA